MLPAAGFLKSMVRLGLPPCWAGGSAFCAIIPRVEITRVQVIMNLLILSIFLGVGLRSGCDGLHGISKVQTIGMHKQYCSRKLRNAGGITRKLRERSSGPSNLKIRVGGRSFCWMSRQKAELVETNEGFSRQRCGKKCRDNLKIKD